ncbi:uncharacterized protein MYCGRDRAFT_103900 [Zymoseptoria tritici IPO323]|uniref:Uncharacterized protein n=1 Tax=Zymoseptoria tritici (strain CBS 115943 / IPO323) TaxID=336722 RepID=F9X5U2_ZYMTI|nr:uncharacterized protein MYCGRDRAFT_103900 [Zymoseptoria tritici IPO323]EGP89227.1 hypothetical protein MYCGRDRAFT_103900 [Zymoseptoria tritici IPO323]
MKSVIFAIATLATLAAATADSLVVRHVVSDEFAHMKFRSVHRRMPQELDQNSCETNWDCGTGQQVIYKDGQCTCKITNGGAACAAAGGDGNTWYTDAEGHTCCPFGGSPPPELQNAKPLCPQKHNGTPP